MRNKTTSKAGLDWPAIEAEYRAGERSVRQIGKVFGVSHAAILKRATAQGWARELPAGAQPGRPSKYSKALADRICAEIARGLSVVSIGAMEEMPAASQIHAWVARHPEFQENYARACEARTQHWAEEIIDIADDGSNDYVERLGKDGEVVGTMLDKEAVMRSKLRVDTRKWLLAKLEPKVYGEKVAVEQSGPNGGPILTKNENAPLALPALETAMAKFNAVLAKHGAAEPTREVSHD